MSLRPLVPPAHLQRLQTLDLISAAKFEIERDPDVGVYTLHEIPSDSGDVALRPTGAPAGTYLRCYPVEVSPGQLNLIMDDVVFEDEDPDFTQEIYWNTEVGTWDVRKIIQE